MLAYEIWTTVLVLGVVFAALYPEDLANLIRLLALTPSMLKLWLTQRWFMLRMGPRLMLDGYIMRRRIRQIRRQYKVEETTNQEEN